MPRAELKIGLLALQGGFVKHEQMLQKLGVSTLQVRNAEQLEACDGLILPGGESTTILQQLEKMEEAFLNFAREKPLFGTCAGAIIMAHFNLIPMQVVRNAYGRQIASFVAQISFEEKKIPAIFIRAPKIVECSPEVNVLMRHEESPILVEYQGHMAATFHPELTTNSMVHKLYVQRLLDRRQQRELVSCQTA